MKTVWSRLVTFLEIIGLRRPEEIDYDSRLAELRLRYFHFRDLLAANHDLLEVVAAMELRLQRRSVVTLRWIRAQVVTALTSAHRMVAALNAVSGRRYQALDLVLTRLEQRLSSCRAMTEPDLPDDWIIPLDRLDRSALPLAGTKMAVLGEIRNVLRLPVPDGFVVTVAAFHRMIEAAGVADANPRGAGDPGGDDPSTGAEGARQRILNTLVPEEMAQRVLAAHQALAPGGEAPPLAVRSSAVEEDSEFSLAGQYLTLLNIRQPDLIDAYRQVVASAFGANAECYRREMGIDESDVAVAVGCLVLVEPLASGVAFSTDPIGTHHNSVLIHAGWGLGPSIVDGRIDPDVHVVSRDDGRITTHVSRKVVRLTSHPAGGVVEDEVPPGDQERPCLTEPEVATLARWAIELERHFGGPQDVEWALDRDRRLVILQSRPATAQAAATSRDVPAVKGAGLLLEGGMTASAGAGAGPVVAALPDDNLDDFPEGGVLVAVQSSPKFVRIMRRASAIVTDVGSAIGHMASLSREYGVPTIVGAGTATARLAPGSMVTVDATRCRVYAGRVDVLLEQAPAPPAARPESRGHSALEEIARFVVPLTLIDVRDDSFTPMACASLHDVARYVHERSFREMFGLSTLVGDFHAQSPILDVFLPIDLYIIDLGGGLAAPPGARKVRRREIVSAPFAALVDGMLHPSIPRFGPRAIDTKGLLDVFMRQALANPHEDDTLRDPCYAIISDRYVNLATRVGFHFSAVDAYAGGVASQNSVSFRFKGGAAGEVRRRRRVEAIALILRHLGFSTNVTADLVDANYRRHDLADTLRAVEMLGRLLQFMRQMDAAMTSDERVAEVADDFLAGRYGPDTPP
ncbi:MAG: PEP-utilizing enzyme [Acidobacteria bacterium]|nr:PEP-utilizing enzyme [Acidobacteriota bacterium]